MLAVALSIPTPNFFGIGEFWSGLIIGVVSVPVVVALLFFLDDWRTSKEASDLRGADVFPDRPAGAGVLVCDYADQEMIRTIAQQKGIELTPKESERGREVTNEGSFGIEKIPFVGKLARRTNERERKRFEHREDYNVLLSEVLDALDRDSDLERNLSRKPEVPLNSTYVINELAGIAGQHSEAQTAREALSTLGSRLMAEQKRREFESVAASNSFVLVEGKWHVTRSENSTLLCLRELTPGPQMYGPEDTEVVPMSNGVALHVTVAHDGLSTQGRARLASTEQTAAVFGTAANLSDGTLAVSPIAVFGRYGAEGRRRGPGRQMWGGGPPGWRGEGLPPYLVEVPPGATPGGPALPHGPSYG